MSVGGLPEREDRPAYVRFEKVSIENKAKSLEQKRYVADDVEFALITPPYSKDVVRQKVSTWLEQMETNVRAGRFPQKWFDQYKEALQAWRNGQELPPNGTPIRGWPVISPAQMDMLLHINILTVEDLAQINDEGARRIGMGSLDLKNKAKAWLSQAQDKGPLVIEMAAVKAENEQLKATQITMQAQLDAVSAQLARLATPGLVQGGPAVTKPAIGLDDILPDGDTDASTE